MSINPTEPSVTTGLSVAGVSAVLAVIDQFSLPISQTWKLVIAFGIVVLAPLVHSVVTRGKVWSPASVAKLQADALGLVASIEAEQPPAVTAPVVASDTALPGAVAGPTDPPSPFMPPKEG